MAGKDRPLSQLHSMAHKHYANQLTGDGAKVEFPIGITVMRVEDIMVFVDGVHKTAQVGGTLNDFSVRGLSSGYAGDTNMIKFAVAPANTKKITIWAVGG